MPPRCTGPRGRSSGASSLRLHAHVHPADAPDGIGDKPRRPAAERHADHVAGFQLRQLERRALPTLPVGDRDGGGNLQADDAEGEADAGRDLERVRASVQRANRVSHAVVRRGGGGLLCSERERSDQCSERKQRDAAHRPLPEKALEEYPYSIGGCRITPMNRIVPDRFSRSAKMNGRSITMYGDALVTPSPTEVTAAATVPSSFTSTYVLCFTSVMDSSDGT